MTAGDGPITGTLPAGTRIWLGSAREPVLRFSGAHSAAWLHDWARTPNGKDPIVVYGDTQGARWALFGFSENAWDSQPTLMNILFANTLDWLQHKQRAFFATWPDGYRAAQLVEMDTENTLDNATDFAAMLNIVHLKGGFYFVSGNLNAASGPA